MKHIVTFFFLALTSLSCVAQMEYTTNKKKAIKYYIEGMKQFRLYNYGDAKELFQKAIDKDEDFVEPYLSLAFLHQENRNYEEALKYYSITAEKDADDKFVLVHKNRAEVLLHLGRYTEAKAAIKTLGDKNGISKEAAPIVKDMLNTAVFGEQAMKNPVPFDPINLGPGVNSKDEEYHPSITVDDQVLVFTRKIPLRTRNGKTVMREDIYYSAREEDGFGFAYNLGKPINTLGYNEGAQCITADGQYIFFTACDKEGGKGSCDIYVAKKAGNGWGEPQNLGAPVNTAAWESQPTLSADGQTLYYVSNRAGGKDIWSSKQGTDGTWSQPKRLPFNTKGSELSPFLHPDGATMYFASNGYTGLGKTDVFVVRRDPTGIWGEPENLGYPINSAGSDHGIVVSSDGKTAYFSSDREGGLGTLDLYRFELPENKRALQVSYLTGMLRDAKTKRPMEADFELIDLSTGELAVASSSESSGRYLVTLPPQKDYALNVSKPGYLFYSESFTLKKGKANDPVVKDVELKPIEVGESVVLNNVFFETGSFQLRKESKAELLKLYEFLKLNAKLRIEIGGHTDNVGSAEGNRKLSEDRAKAVFDFLVKEGIAEDRLTYKGYGAENPIADNTTEEGRAKNRRTEFMVIE